MQRQKYFYIFFPLVTGVAFKRTFHAFGSYNQGILQQDRLHPFKSLSTTFLIIVLFVVINDEEFIVMQLLVNIAVLSTWYPLNSKCFTKETEHFLSQFTSGQNGAKES